MVTLQDIITFERLTDRTFLTFGQEQDDIFTLMYCHDHSEQRKHTLDFYVKTTKDHLDNPNIVKEVNKFAQEIQKDIEFCNQFVKTQTERNRHDDEPIDKLSPLILLIMMDGIEPSWVLSQGVEWLDILAEAHQIKMDRQYKYDRFWHTLYFGFKFDKKHKGDYRKLIKELETEDEKQKHSGNPKLTPEQELSIGRALWGPKKKASTVKT